MTANNPADVQPEHGHQQCRPFSDPVMSILATNVLSLLSLLFLLSYRSKPSPHNSNTPSSNLRIAHPNHKVLACVSPRQHPLNLNMMHSSPSSIRLSLSGGPRTKTALRRNANYSSNQSSSPSKLSCKGVSKPCRWKRRRTWTSSMKSRT